MKKHIYFLFLVCLIACKESKWKDPMIQKGIPIELAQARQKQIQNVHYDLKFQIPATKEEKINAKLELTLDVKNLERDLILDFNEETSYLDSLYVNDKTSKIEHIEEHIVINKELLKIGSNKINIVFRAGELSLNRNDEYLYTLLVPDRASTLFPCFDQPDIKATYKLTIAAPEEWKVLCGAPEEKKTTTNKITTHYFKNSDKMSTYLFSFVAGKFSEENKTLDRFPMRLLYRETDSKRAAVSIPKIFEIHQNSLDFLESYTNYSFPFQKMDFATIPGFQYGGMEHTGAIQYREKKLFLDKYDSPAKKLERAKLIAHETSHMWFGNLVTMKWFDDVWMKEVFANFMADKIMNPVFPYINHDLIFMMDHYPKAYSEDRTKGTNPIRQNLANLKNAGSLYGRIIYNKAPIMMRQLEFLLGKEMFQKGVQKYIATYANGNADWNDLISIFDTATDQNVKEWSSVWVNSSSRPIISDSISYEGNRISKFKIFQKAEDGTDKVWPQSFQVGLIYKNKVDTIHVTLKDRSYDATEAIGKKKPEQIIYNYNGFGYGIFPGNYKSIHRIKNDVARGYAYINNYENMLHGKITPEKALDICILGLQNEDNGNILDYIANQINIIFWKFLHPEKRLEFSEKITKILSKQLLKSKLATFQKHRFYLLEDIGITPDGIDLLYQVWKKDTKIKFLDLNESEFTFLAMKLALYKHPKVDEILEIQKNNISNPDEKNRFIWLLPSLSQDVNIRDAFMQSLAEAKNREKERWVTAALANIHHPLRQSESIKHFDLCLELLQEIQLTGDIFFPKRWLNNSVGLYNSEEAYRKTQDFIKKYPDYNPILMKKLLLVIDDLERAQYLIQP